ncbi:MAG TPA: GDSL-type esterase/lipase family protein [Planctomycetota bacterium]|nr:GDSL-type esterase/lipase family protein [Planctomycetota bacterium]
MRCILAVLLLTLAQDPKTEPFAKEIEAFEAKDKTAPPPQNEIVFVGSSSIRLWKSTEAFPDLKIINRGFGGSQMADSVHFAERIILPYKPRIVVVFAGGNDINAKKTPERVVEDYKALVGKIHAALPRTKLYFISLFPNVARKSQDAQCQKVNEMIEAYSKTDPRLGYMETANKMRAADGGPRPELLRADGLHMNDDGYKIWNEIVGAVLRKAP